MVHKTTRSLQLRAPRRQQQLHLAWIRKQLEAYGDDTDSIRKFGEEVVTEMCQKLLKAGAPGLHFYTLNQAEPSLSIWKNLGISDREKIAF